MITKNFSLKENPSKAKIEQQRRTIYLFGDITGVAASKWHMTPKKDHAKCTNMQTDAADASKSKQKR